MKIKACLDTQIRKQLEHQREEDYILLDRGEGAAVCFLVEPKTALFFALNLREAIRSQRKCSFPCEVHAGINLGPVKIIRDVNGDKTTFGGRYELRRTRHGLRWPRPDFCVAFIL